MRVQRVVLPQRRRATFRLSPLQPRGLDTAEVECLSSYICRLAKLHWMHPHALANQVRRFAMNDTRTAGGGGNLLGRLNGAGEPALQTAEGLRRLCAAERTESLTVIAWQNILSPMMHGVLARTIRYCPLCLADDIGSGNEPYVRLLWIIGPNTACPKYEVSLELGCPTCKQPLNIEPWQPDQFFCMICRTTIFECSKWDRSTQSASKFSLLSAYQLSDLLERTHKDRIEIETTAVPSFVEHIVRTHCDGSDVTLAKRLQMDETGCRRWRLGENKPNFETLVRIAIEFGESVGGFLSGRTLNLFAEYGGTARSSRAAQYRARAPEGLRLKAKTAIQSLLKQSTELPPISYVCAEYGLSRYIIRYHYPKLYDHYMTRKVDEQVARRAAIREDRVERIARAAEAMIANNIYPSQRRLRLAGVANSSDLRRVEVKQALYDLVDASPIQSKLRD